MGRPPIKVNRTIMSSDNDRFSSSRTFNSIPEASSATGLTDRGIRAAYHSKFKDLRGPPGGASLARSKDLQLGYMDTDSLVYRIKPEDFYIDIADDVPTRFDTSSYIPDHPLPVGLTKKVIGLMKDELEGVIVIEFIALRPKLILTESSMVQKIKSAKK